MELARPLLEDSSGSALETVAGISFRRGDTAVMTPARPLVPELDRALTRLALLYWSAARVRNYGRQLAAGPHPGPDRDHALP
ncbi:MAG TPA: hypothetical protein PK640_12380, partial [Verrucomicrobiota bacterium]|nr:hypothetical protein [Verrucomicrobiota bacterium]